MRWSFVAIGAIGIGLGVAAAESVAFAAGNEAAAEALFVEAKKLADEGKFAEACPKFAESNRLDRGAGTLIHLGNCYEKNHQTASAWATYKEAASAAQALGRKDWEKLATQRATALEPKLAKLTIKVADPGVEVSRDGTVVSQASFGVAIPVDVGPHVVEAKAAGHVPFKTTATVAKDGDTVEVAVPNLEKEAAAQGAPPPSTAQEPTPAPAPAKTENGSSQRTIGFVVGGVGIAGVAVGAITGLMAVGKSNDAKAICPNDGSCASHDAVDASDSAKSLGLLSTIGFIAGGVGLAAGAALVLTAPKEDAKAARVRVSPHAGPGGAGLTVLGVF
jgi:hypothetical protein